MTKNVWNFIAICLAIFGGLIFFIEVINHESTPMKDTIEVDALSQTDSFLIYPEGGKEKWFPVPISSIEKIKSGKCEYMVMLENGFMFYTNKKYDLKDTICWMNTPGDLKFKSGNIINGSNLY